jgi:hypothetical protein
MNCHGAQNGWLLDSPGGEEPGKLYWYDDAGERHETAGEFPDIRSF